MIIHLRRHSHCGPGKISMYLRRYHDVEISKSGVWRILHRLDMGRLPASPNATNDTTVDGHAVRKQRPPAKRKVAGSIPALATEYLPRAKHKNYFPLHRPRAASPRYCAQHAYPRRQWAAAAHRSWHSLFAHRTRESCTAVLCADWPA
jgi:hypothetical protein